MGSSSSKFRKHLQNGDEVAALNVYNSHSDLRKALDPNCSYGDSFQHETPLHYASRHGMKSLLRIFLYEQGGNPNKTNGRKETALHCVCMEKNSQFYPVHRRRMECLILLLQWRGAELKDGEIEKVDFTALDEEDNTALHYAASSGLKTCVELMVQHGAPLFNENKSNQTPCDCAESSGHSEIALYLESKMVFSHDTSTEEIEEMPPTVDSEVHEYSGLRAQDLQEAKDQLLVETADMLSIPLFTAEALLRNHEWSREVLLDAWMTDALACCEKSGVTPPSNLFSEKPVVEQSLSSPTLTELPDPFADCDICTQSFPMTEEPVHMPCHQFCRECWEGYLNVKIQEGLVHHITCPGYNCTKLVPVEVIENVVSRDMARRYLQFDIKAFVDSNPSINWCPFPGCGRAVKFPEGETASARMTSPRHSKIPSDTSRAVDCGNGHHFCWECLGEAHEPCSCEGLQLWLKEVADIKPETLDGTEMQTESAANCLWLVTNSKPCPNCKSPIQKNEGCNHMKCSKCKYDFCWVCLDQWKRHNSSTGGYFKCNRYEVVKKVEDGNKTAVAEAEEKNSKMQELNKFVHYYTRYKNHENSYKKVENVINGGRYRIARVIADELEPWDCYLDNRKETKLEEPLLKTAKEKMLKLAEAVTDLATAKDETKFVEEAVHQLLKARRMLKFSYVYGYYLSGPPYRKIVFEFMQTELEECTEILSQMVNRLYLRTPRKKIIEQSGIVHRKRAEFITAISKGLVPPETPPGMRKRRRKYSMDTEDEDLRKAILASIEDFDPSNPWIVDASGRHTNVAILDWPSDDSDDDQDPSEAVKQAAQSPTPGKCRCCPRPRAKNPRTEEYHEFCSLRCSRLFKQQQREVKQEDVPEGLLDEQMDLLRALEMSRLQFLKEQGLVRDEEERTDLTSSGDSTEQGGYRQPRHHHDNFTPAERLDLELKHMLELSALSGEGDDEDQLNMEAGYHDNPSGDENLAQNQTSRFGDNQSTIVSRVPNKSVEDLYHADCTGCQGLQGLSPPTPVSLSAGPTSVLPGGEFDYDEADLEMLGAFGGVASPEEARDQPAYSDDSDLSAMVDDLHIEGHMLQKLLNTDKIDMSYQEIFPTQASGFGVIKDISVSNIHIDDSDKTKEFGDKDLSSLSGPSTTNTNSRKGCGRLFAANTPGDEDHVFSLISPESDFSESSSSEQWGYRPQVRDTVARGQTPETDSSFEGSSYADLINQNADSPLCNEDVDGEPEEMSIVEMTKNLVQMTSEMQNRLECCHLDNISPDRSPSNDPIHEASATACVASSCEADVPEDTTCAQSPTEVTGTQEILYRRPSLPMADIDLDDQLHGEEQPIQVVDLEAAESSHPELSQYICDEDKSTYV